MATISTQRTILRSLYRSLIRASRPFTPPNPNAVVLNCLIHRTGTEDALWEDFLRGKRHRHAATESSSASALADADEEEEDKSSSGSDDDDDDEYYEISSDSSDDDDDEDPSHVMFRKLLREVVTGNQKGIRQMQFPAHIIDPYRIRNVIRREFRREDNVDQNSNKQKLAVNRKQVAFMALRKLNEKLVWAHNLEQTSPVPHKHQAAHFVSSLPLRPPESYLRPGSFLIAHPNLNGYFRRSVICILEHQEAEDVLGVKKRQIADEEDDDDQTTTTRQSIGTYGLIINRPCVIAHSGRHLSLEETVRPLPDQLKEFFGDSLVRDGGPVQVSLQMLHSLSPDAQEELRIGGHVLPMIPPSSDDNDSSVESTALRSDRAVFYQGDILKAAAAVSSERLDPSDVTFYVGASSWIPGQLESEIERGLWLPCRGPPEMAQTGTCEHQNDNDGDDDEEEEERPKDDLWLSLLSACGEDEAKLAHLVWNDNGDHPYGAATDNFD